LEISSIQSLKKFVTAINLRVIASSTMIPLPGSSHVTKPHQTVTDLLIDISTGLEHTFHQRLKIFEDVKVLRQFCGGCEGVVRGNVFLIEFKRCTLHLLSVHL